MSNKELVIIKYVELSKKLGKLASDSDCVKFKLRKTILYHYQTLNKFKELVLAKYPELEGLQTPAKLNIDDLELFRHKNEVSEIKKGNSKFISNVSTLDYIAEFADSVFKGRVQATKYKKSKEKIARVHNLVLSDLHFGSDIKAIETGAQDYGAIEEARRFAFVIREAAAYKEQYRDQTKLKMLILGDVIENAMHDLRTGAPVAEQVCRAIHLLTQGVAYMATKYPQVEVEWQTGNHDRQTSRHHGRAVHQKWDSYGTIIAFAVKSATSLLKNVVHNIPKSPLSSYLVFGKRIGITHGDSVLHLGNPGSALNTRSLENQVNKLNSALKDTEEYSVLIHGHTHTAYILHLSNGCVLIGNGSLPSPDDFSVSIGITETKGIGQWIFESVEGYPVGDARYLKIPSEYDQDTTLDAVIKPYKNLND